MKWPTQQLNEVADFRLGKMLDEKKNRGDLMPYLANVNVRWGEFDLSELREMRFEDHEVDTFGLRHGDIVMCEGGEPGRCAIWKEQLPGMMIQKAIHRIRPHACLNHEFLYYTFLYMGKTGRFSALFTGATIKHLPREKLALLEVAVPPLPVQKSIGSLLSAYDDLIENNRRRMALLEESARLLYQEWFVRLRFPGHEHTTNNNGVPHGWEKKTLAELVEVQSGFAFKSGTYETSGLYGIVTIKNVQDGDFLPSCDAFLDKPPENMSKDCHLRTGDILLSLTGNIGRCCFVVGENYLLNQRVAKLLPTLRCPRAFVYTEFRSERMRKQLEAISHGVAQQNLSPVKMLNLAFIIPSVGLLCRFSEIVEPMLDQLLVLKEQNQKLRAARDLLLPRLMNGEVIV